MIQTILISILFIDFIYIGYLIYKMLTEGTIRRKFYNGEDVKKMKQAIIIKYSVLVIGCLVTGVIVGMVW